MSLRDRVRAWLALSRPPFHLVGILPFLLGTWLAWRLEQVFRWPVFVLGVLGVVAIMLATYFAGEYWDYEEDSISGSMGASRFAGGSQVTQRGLVSRSAVLRASFISLALAGAIGITLQFVFRTGVWTIPLGIAGILGGFFYSTRPLRWVSSGWGELWIAGCYGWLPVAIGFYLPAGTVQPLVHWMTIPIGLTIFNVILLNEFLDYAADLAAGKRNLTVRLGRERAVIVYDVVAIASWAVVFLSVISGVPLKVWWFYLPVMALSLALVVLVTGGRWRDRRTLGRLCGANIVVNLGTTAAFMLAFL